MSVKYAATKPTRLSNSCTPTATSITVAEIVDRQGVPLVTSDLVSGTSTFDVVFEPGSENEEHASATTITGNVISGLGRGRLMKDPFTATGTGIAHAAGTKVIILTNTPSLYKDLATNSNDETVLGTWTFTNPNVPRMDTAHTYGAGEEEYLATKRYADSLAIAGAPDSNETTKGLVEQATQAEVDAGTDAGTTTAPLNTRPSKVANTIQRGVWLKFTETASGDDSYTAATTPVVVEEEGTIVNGVFATANTTACTFALNAGAAVAIKKYVSGAVAELETGDIIASMPVVLRKTGAVWILLNPTGTMPTTAIMSEMATFFGTTDITGAEAETLTAGATSDASALHRHTAILVDPDIAGVAVTNSGTGTQTILTQAIAGGVLGTSNAIRISFSYEIANSGGHTESWTLAITYGGTVIFSVAGVVGGASGTSWIGSANMVLLANAATNSQRSRGTLHGAVATTGVLGAATKAEVLNLSASIDSTTAQNLVFTAKSVGNTNDCTIMINNLIIERI